MIIGKILAQGYLTSSLETLYSVSAPITSSYIKFFSLYNEGTEAISIVINISGSESVPMTRLELAVSESALVVDKDEAIVLSTFQKIQGIASVTGSIAYTLVGGEE